MWSRITEVKNTLGSFERIKDLAGEVASVNKIFETQAGFMTKQSLAQGQNSREETDDQIIINGVSF